MTEKDSPQIIDASGDSTDDDVASSNHNSLETRPKEYGGSNKPEPTRYGDWEVAGRCSDF